jgi:hypothetical protein
LHTRVCVGVQALLVRYFACLEAPSLTRMHADARASIDW